MSDYAFDPVQLANEINELSRKIAAGVDILAHLKSLDVGLTPREEIYTDQLLTLYRYTPVTELHCSTPLLIVPSLFNRPYLFDLQPNRSFIHGLLEQGIDLYLIDWGNPQRSDRFIDCNDYITGFMRRAIRFITAHTHFSQINLMGDCLGGIFSLAFAALYPERVQNLVLCNTPINFQQSDNKLVNLLKYIQVDAMVESYGNIPGEMIASFTAAINPFRAVGKRLLEFLDHLDKREETLFFLRMNKWFHDSPNLAGETFRNLITDLFQRNLLIQNQWKLGTEKVNLENIAAPLLNIHALRNTIIPPASSALLEKATQSKDYTALSPDCGHAGLFVVKKEEQAIPRQISEWLIKRDGNSTKADQLV